MEFAYDGGGMSVGPDTDSPATSNYKAPLPSTGKSYTVKVDASRDLIRKTS